MPIGIGAGAAIAGIAGAGAAVTSGVINSRAAHHAADVQSNYDNQALADARQQRARTEAAQARGEAAYNDWLHSGAAGQLGSMITSSRPQASAAPGMPSQPPIPSQAPMAPPPQTQTIAQMRQPVPNATAMVTLVSPDGGETRRFRTGDPAIETYLAKGARRVA